MVPMIRIRHIHVPSFQILKMSDFSGLVYHSLDAILNKLEKKENKNVQEVQELLRIYEEKNEQKLKEDALEGKMHPLIVLEGLDGSGKTSVGNRFAKRIGAIKWKTPPESICHIREVFDGNLALRPLYYSLGNYIAALEVQTLLRRAPVVMDRYWHSTIAYAIGQAVQDNPEKYILHPEGDEIYRWPKDLFKPNIVLFLDVSEKVRMQRQSRRRNVTAQESLLNDDVGFRKNVIQAFTNMKDPSMTFINGDLNFGLVLKEMSAKSQHLLNN